MDIELQYTILLSIRSARGGRRHRIRRVRRRKDLVGDMNVGIE